MDNLSNIFARNCSIRRIDKTEAAAFMNACHRLGDTSCRYRYGMFIERHTGSNEASLPPGTLVAVSEFSNARRWIKDGIKVSSYEWIRYASLPGIRVMGGMGKMLRTFIDDIHPDDIMSYADSSWPDGGEVYLTLGFKEEGMVERPGFKCRKFRLKVIEQAHSRH